MTTTAESQRGHPGKSQGSTTKQSANGHASLLAWAEMSELSRYLWTLPPHPLQVRNATLSKSIEVVCKY